ncbi:heme oxygenase (decycling) 1 [Halocaridina rubra]|uniref:Heme oxygenase n=1 Tax=Halocaridina rubra TaxID=373956 RepID=A0AAN8X947_HALRR
MNTEPGKSDVPFTKQMRIVTREIHNVSDGLINAKLGIAMSEDRVWAEGLLVFYEIFKYLEGALERFSHTLIGDLDIPGMRRVEAFEKDLTYYMGIDWQKDYTPRDSVVEYLKHLEKIENENPYYLTAYIYHLYMGLLSGGQILRRKRVLLQKLKFSRKDSTEGMAVTEISGGTVASIKKQMTEAMNHIAAELDEEERQRLLEESKMVFILNNKIVHTIQGAGAVVAIKVLKLGVYGIIVALLYKYIKKFAWG